MIVRIGIDNQCLSQSSFSYNAEKTAVLKTKDVHADKATHFAEIGRFATQIYYITDLKGQRRFWRINGSHIRQI